MPSSSLYDPYSRHMDNVKKTLTQSLHSRLRQITDKCKDCSQMGVCVQCQADMYKICKFLNGGLLCKANFCPMCIKKVEDGVL